MVKNLYLTGKRLLVSKSRGTVRGSAIWVFTHLLLLIGLVFAAVIILLLLGAYDIYVPLAGKIMGLIPKIPRF